MNIFKVLFKKIFQYKENHIKKIASPKNSDNSSNEFKESIKVNSIHNNNIEILKCEGNGAGISDTISY